MIKIQKGHRHNTNERQIFFKFKMNSTPMARPQHNLANFNAYKRTYVLYQNLSTTNGKCNAEKNCKKKKRNRQVEHLHLQRVLSFIMQS